MYLRRKSTSPAPTRRTRTDVEMATLVTLEVFGEISFSGGEGLSGCGVTFGVTTVEGSTGLWRAREGSLMHLRLGVVQWAVFVFLLITHSVSVDVPAFRLKPELQTYLSLEFTL